MTLTKTKRWMIRGGVITFAVVGGAFAACKAEGPPRPTCGDVVDGGARDALAIPVYTAVTTDAQPIEVYGMDPDPGPACLDCTQDSDSEIMVVADFEDGFAPGWFNYGEPGVLIEPQQAGNAIDEAGITQPKVNPPPPYWGLQVSTLEQAPGGERCGSKYALHMEGGRFSVWGGGYVTRHFITRGEFMERVTPTGQTYCVPGQNKMEGDPKENGVGWRPDYMPLGAQVAATATGCSFWASPVTQQPSLLGVDVSDFDGVTFWARRGPSGQATLRIALVDDSTSTDLALQQERDYAFDAGFDKNPDNAGAACKRVRDCCRKCDDHLTHQQYNAAKTPSADAGEDAGDAGSTEPFITVVEDDKRCHVDGERLPEFRYRNCDNAGTEIVAWDFRNPECGDVPTNEDLCPMDVDGGDGGDSGAGCWSVEAKEIWDSWDRDYALCCPTTMDDEIALGDPSKTYGDPRWGGTKCRPYVFNFDYSSGNYCHNEGDILPEKNQNRCGESFETSVVVDTEWKLFRIPWSELRRFTPDKPPFNPKSVWQVAFYFGQGFLDTYIDDVGFYRKRK